MKLSRIFLLALFLMSVSICGCAGDSDTPQHKIPDIPPGKKEIKGGEEGSPVPPPPKGM